MRYQDLEFEILFSKRKTIAIEVGKNLSVTVKAPNFTPDKIVLDFVKSRYEWIQKAKARQIKRAEIYDMSLNQLDELKNKAKAYIPKRVEFFSKIMQLYPTAVKINTAKTRFGSCSGKNSLNFSAYLMLFPIDAIDYVIVHELAHIKHRNHQKEFYSLVEKYLPDYKRRASLLKIK